MQIGRVVQNMNGLQRARQTLPRELSKIWSATIDVKSSCYNKPFSSIHGCPLGIQGAGPAFTSLMNQRPGKRIQGRKCLRSAYDGSANDAPKELDCIQRAYYTNHLYVLYFAACLMERTWRFALPVILSNIPGDGYRAVAMLCFISPFACLIFAPAIGRILDTVDRAFGVWSLLAVQCSSIILSGCILLHAFKYSLSITSGPIFYFILFLQMIEKLAAVTSEVAIERDWLTQLCGRKNTLALAHGNSMLRRMDLACDFIGTVSYGWIFDLVGAAGSIMYTTLIAIISTPLLYMLIYLKLRDGLDSNVSAAQRLKKGQLFSDRKLSITSHAWKQYFSNNPMLASSIVVVFLYFNVALSPGGILTAFLTFKGMNGTSLAIFRGACAIMGFVGSYSGKVWIKKFGLLGSGRFALTSMLASLGSSVAVFLLCLNSASRNDSLALLVFTSGIVLSRIGMWSFDMVNTQLFQQYTDESQSSGIASTEMALCSLSEIFMLGLAAFLSVPIDSFYVFLVASSYGAVVFGAIVFSLWSKDKEQHLELVGIQ